MPSPSSDARFFGIDLHAASQEIRRPWRGLHQSPALAWLTPQAPVRLLHADGAVSTWVGSNLQSSPSGAAVFTAVELPEDHLLRRTFSMPVLADADIANAVALEVLAMSPFGAQDTVSGYRTQPGSRGMRPVEVIVASRKQITRYLAAQSERLQHVAEPEVWALSTHRQPIELGGYGVRQRAGYGTRFRRTGYVLIALALLLLIALAFTPTAQLAMRATEAAATYQATQRRVAPLVQQREALLQSAEQLNALAEVLGARIEPLRMQDMLTRVLPDDTFLQNLRLQGNKVTISGLTADASILMQLLSAQPGVTNVRAPSAATRLGAAAKETFSIEFLLDPQKFGGGGAVVAASKSAGSAAQSASGASAPGSPASAVASTSGTPITGIAAAASAVVAPAPAAPTRPSGGATFGGGPTFGGNAAKAAPPAPAAPSKAAP